MIQAWDFKAGNNFVLEMDNAAKNCERTIAVLSHNYVKSIYTQPEWAMAFVDDPMGASCKLIPVRVEDIKLEGLLKPIVYVDLVDLEEEAAKESLLRGIEQKRGKPESKPIFNKVRKASKEEATYNKPIFPSRSNNIFHVPFRRNSNFTGREDKLDEIHRALIAGDKNAVAIQAISGLGGIGKTQLALEYAYRYRGNYHIIWWINAEKEEVITSRYMELALEMGFENLENGSPKQIVGQILRHMEKLSDWLIILDNASKQKALEDFLPSGTRGKVLITSRDSAWRKYATPIKLDIMSEKEAVGSLVLRSGNRDEEGAAKLADRLGYLPLALAQAAAYMEETVNSTWQI